MLRKYRNIIIVIVLVGVGFIAYTLYKPDPEVTKQLEVVARQDSAEILGDEISRAINQIQSLKLDRDVFDDPVLKNLIDHSKPIVPEPVGRRNPFAPIGVGGTSGNPNVSNSTSTSATATTTKAASSSVEIQSETN